ncbi:MAG: hypothetical protein IPL28_07585 [Chloroflexi bacterium]|nr:hypothetical protein [Chloroflexota bacterium]
MAQTTLDPRNSGTWQVRVTNHGALADVYDLELGGLAAVGGSLSANVVSLAPGASQTVQLTLSELDPLVPQSYLLSVAAVSRANALIADEDTTAVALLGYEAVQVAWFPASQTVTGTLSAQVLLVITNTANSNAVYDLSAVMAGGSSTVGIGQIVLPAHGTVQVVVNVAAPQAGTYSVVGTADSPNSPASGSALATVVFVEGVEPPPANPVIYLPLIMRVP